MLITKIKQERLKRNWTLEYIAKNIGLTNQAISRIETGKQKPSYDVLIKICKLFNVNTTEIEQLFAVVDDAPNSN